MRKIQLIQNLLSCGTAGLGMELVFTSLGGCMRHERTLMGQTSLYMFPIYSCAAFFRPLCFLLKKRPPLIRGGIYSIMIFGFEYLSGRFLRKRGCCPWDYSGTRFHINGLIRLDYLPLWMGAGLLFERILLHSSSANS